MNHTSKGPNTIHPPLTAAELEQIHRSVRRARYGV